jgi:PAS domain S-box-containing protein
MQKVEYSKELYQHILEAAPDGFWIMDGEGRFSDVNESYLALSGYRRKEFLSLGIADIDALESPEETENKLLAIKEAGTAAFRTQHRRRDGSIFHAEISVSHMPLKEAEHFVCFCRDISGQIEAEETMKRLLTEKELLLKEIHHRVKNDLSFVYSILRLQSELGRPGDGRELLREAQHRISVVIQVYEELYQGKSLKEVDSTRLVQRIIDRMVGMDPETPPSFTSRVKPFAIPARMVIAAATVLNEMITNSIKYGTQAEKPGSDIRIALSRTDEGYIRISVRDRGPGFPEEVLSGERTGFGMTVIEALASQFDGEVTLENNGGAEITVLMKVTEN